MCQPKIIERKNNRVVTYIDCGNPDGKVIVFLHGWGADKENLSAIYNQLTEYYRIISFDLPGFGGSTRPEWNWGSREYALEIKECLGELNINYYSIIGHSFGGKIAGASCKNTTKLQNFCMKLPGLHGRAVT
jgi:pimeloyl-ACP methyl ester carboxylesterase